MTLKLENIRLSFDGFCVLNDINLTVETGEFVCLLGPSGCGKTSTLRICAGLETPASGRVIMDDQVITDGPNVLAPEKRNIGFLFQDFALFPHMNVFDNVAFGLKGESKNFVEERVEEVLKQVRMERYAKALPHTLSGGQQQRIALARALAPNPSIILLDEPFSGLDAGLRAEIRDETMHVLKKNNVAAVMVTHDPEEAMFMANRIVLMKDGSIVQNGAPSELYLNPVDHFAASFFGEVNTVKGHVQNGQAHTLIGSVPANDFKDGEMVDVLVRPENIHVRPQSSEDQQKGLMTTVNAVRYLGRDTLLHLTSENPQNDSVHLHARINAGVDFKCDAAITPYISENKAYVFRAGR
jgi:iron(III) transport system ATP-binding protein